jgi:hypothetical protein
MKPSATHYSAPVRINDSRGRSTLPKDLFHYDETGLSLPYSAHFIHRFPVESSPSETLHSRLVLTARGRLANFASRPSQKRTLAALVQYL